MLGFLRALRLCGEQAHIVARTHKDKILETEYRCDVNWVRPTHTLSLEIFKESIKQVRKTAGKDTLVVLPSTEYFNTFLLENRSQIEQLGCEVPLVAAPLYATLTGKCARPRLFLLLRVSRGRAGARSPHRGQCPTRSETEIQRLVLWSISLVPAFVGNQITAGDLPTEARLDRVFLPGICIREAIAFICFSIFPRMATNSPGRSATSFNNPSGKSMLLGRS